MATVVERYNISAGKPYTTRDGEAKKQWVNIGRATKWDDGGISLEFNAIPVGNWWDGKASLFVDDGQRQQTGNGTPRQNAPRPQRAPSATDGARQEFVDSSLDDVPFITWHGGR